MRKLAALHLDSNHTVLEIGTGSGYHTALLSERVGAQRVTTIEVDQELAATAEATLKSQGYEPLVIAGDGLLGAPDRAPFDRVISTAAVRRIPHAWVGQTRDRGKILTPFGTAYSNAGLLDLTVDGDQARGRFIGHHRPLRRLVGGGRGHLMGSARPVGGGDRRVRLVRASGPAAHHPLRHQRRLEPPVRMAGRPEQVGRRLMPTDAVGRRDMRSA
ncbi:methyltransferase domain-containing protein [Streptomyces sp. NBC_00091]|nr:methyltransferase domain-containing protein [Streptomyces sp. NBC_00091]